MEQLRIEIEGMSCGHCVKAVTLALGELEGVSITSVSVGHAEVSYDAAQTNVQNILDAVTEAGYPAHATTGTA